MTKVNLQFLTKDATIPQDMQGYGEIYKFDNAVATTISTVSVPVQVTVFDTNGETRADVVPDHTNDHVTIPKDGDYLVLVSCTLSSATGTAATFKVFVATNNGVTTHGNAFFDRYLSGGATDTGSASISGILSLSANDTVEVWVENESNNADVVIQNITLTIEALHTYTGPDLSNESGTDFLVPGLMYDATTDEFAYYQFIATNYAGGDIEVSVYWAADTATTGSTVWQVRMGAMSSNLDSDGLATKTLGSTRWIQQAHLGTTAKRLHKATIVYPNDVTLSQNDVVFFFVSRDADSTYATDDMAGDARVVAVAVEYLSV